MVKIRDVLIKVNNQDRDIQLEVLSEGDDRIAETDQGSVKIYTANDQCFLFAKGEWRWVNVGREREIE